jgi:hypothetical protein
VLRKAGASTTNIKNPGRWGPLEVVPMYSVKEAAMKLGTSDRRVRFLFKEGRIEGKKLGHDWVVLSLDYQRKRKIKRRKGEWRWSKNL